MSVYSRRKLKLWTLPLLLPLLASSPRNTQTGPRVLLLYDMEGLISVTSGRDVSFGSPGYPEARTSLANEVNAAIRGLLEGGASEVVITDGHGSGNPDPDYDLSQLPDGARFEIRDVPYDAYIDVLDPSISAVVAIGMHGGAGGEGFLAHTYYGHTRWVLNGQAMNESMLLAASAARFGAPLLLVTGDDVLKREVEAFDPAVTFVVTKRVVGPGQVEARDADEVLAEIEVRAEVAVRELATRSAWSPGTGGGEMVSHLSYTLPEHASLAINFPGAVGVNDRTISLRASRFLDAYLAFRALANFTAYAPFRTMFEALQEVEGGMDTFRRLRTHLADRPPPSFEPAADEIDGSASAQGRHGYR